MIDQALWCVGLVTVAVGLLFLAFVAFVYMANYITDRWEFTTEFLAFVAKRRKARKEESK